MRGGEQTSARQLGEKTFVIMQLVVVLVVVAVCSSMRLLGTSVGVGVAPAEVDLLAHLDKLIQLCWPALPLNIIRGAGEGDGGGGGGGSATHRKPVKRVASVFSQVAVYDKQPVVGLS